MNISLSRRLKVNLGNYESYEFSAQATVNHGDLGLTDVDVQEGVANEKKEDEFLDALIERMRVRCEKTLDVLLIEDIKTAQGITEEVRSVVLRSFTSLQQTGDQPTRQPARTARRPRRG